MREAGEENEQMSGGLMEGGEEKEGGLEEASGCSG